VKIALLGSAPSSIGRAPFKNENYLEWLGGKPEELNRTHGDVPGDFQIWGCSPGCWGIAPRSDRWFEVHRWEPSQAWFSGEYVQFLRDYKGPVYTGGRVPEIPNHVVYPIDRMEEKFSSYFMASSLSLMLALAIDEIEQIREARKAHRAAKAELDAGVPCTNGVRSLPMFVDDAELEKPDEDDVIGLWGVDMAATEEYGYQRLGCQFFILEAMRRGIGVYLPPESDLMRPTPVYGISEWDHNYIKLTSRARELNAKAQGMQKQLADAQQQITGVQGEMHALNHFVHTWTSPYGMLPGMVIRQTPGTGLGAGITHFDGRPVSRMTVEEKPPVPVLEAITAHPDAQLGRELCSVLMNHVNEGGVAPNGESAVECLRRIIGERDSARELLVESRKGPKVSKTQKPSKPGKPTKRRR
jgi:hypothetical protein